MSDSISTLALASAALKAVGDLVKAKDAQVRQDLTAAYVATYKSTGIKSLDVLLDGKKVATATLSIPSEPDVTVTDQRAFHSWLKANHPDAFEMYQPDPVERIKPSFTEGFLPTLTQTPDGFIDPDGEIVPGVTLPPTPDPKSYSIRFTSTGASTLLAAWRQGQLAALDAPMLEAADE